MNKIEKEKRARKAAMKAYKNHTGDQEVSGEQRTKFEEVWDKHNR